MIFLVYMDIKFTILCTDKYKNVSAAFNFLILPDDIDLHACATDLDRIMAYTREFKPGVTFTKQDNFLLL